MGRNRQKAKLQENIFQVTCQIPFDYIEEKGFEEVKDISLSKFKLYRNKNR